MKQFNILLKYKITDFVIVTYLLCCVDIVICLQYYVDLRWVCSVGTRIIEGSFLINMYFVH